MSLIPNLYITRNRNKQVYCTFKSNSWHHARAFSSPLGTSLEDEMTIIYPSIQGLVKSSVYRHCSFLKRRRGQDGAYITYSWTSGPKRLHHTLCRQPCRWEVLGLQRCIPYGVSRDRHSQVDRITAEPLANIALALVHERTMPTERPPFVGEVVPTLADRGCRVVSATDSYGR
jgi:hypothetical protein